LPSWGDEIDALEQVLGRDPLFDQLRFLAANFGEILEHDCCKDADAHQGSGCYGSV
jgi:hypothetical protein